MFSIFRSDESLKPLRTAWDQADEALRGAISQATQQLENQLRQEPQELGESREGQTRILFEAPVAVLFEVDQAEKLVRILRSWAYCRVPDNDDRRS